MTTSTDITKQALAEIGTRSQITSLADGSTEAQYANLLYGPLRDFLLRSGDFDFALKFIAATAGTTPPTPWVYAWQYPTDCIAIRTLVPTAFDPLDPVPIPYTLITVSSVRYIATRDAASQIVYTYAPIEDLWDAMFKESFVRLLGSALDFALKNRPPVSREFLEQALTFAGIENMKES